MSHRDEAQFIQPFAGYRTKFVLQNHTDLLHAPNGGVPGYCERALSLLLLRLPKCSPSLRVYARSECILSGGAKQTTLGELRNYVKQVSTCCPSRTPRVRCMCGNYLNLILWLNCTNLARVANLLFYFRVVHFEFQLFLIGLSRAGGAPISVTLQLGSFSSHPLILILQ